MSGLTATELAKRLSVTKGRVSQWVSEGKLDGCYRGDGRQRRFDLSKTAEALGRKLDPGQMLGNGAKTRRALQSEPDEDAARTERSGKAQKDLLAPRDPDRYELARIQKTEEEARKLRRQNLLEEGSMILAEEAARQVKRQMAQEIAAFENLLRDAARHVADQMQVDYRQVRAILTEQWREHRGERQSVLQDQAAAAQATDAEKDADF